MHCRLVALAVAAMGFVVGPVLFPSTSAAGSCSKPIMLVRGASLRRRAAAKKIARKKVYKIAKLRCRGRRIVFMARWQYKCSKRGRYMHCKARNKIRCCGSKRSRRNNGFQRTNDSTPQTVMVRRSKRRRVKYKKDSSYRIAVAKSRSNRKYKLRRKAKRHRKSKRRRWSKRRRRVARRYRKKASRKNGTLNCRVARLEVKGYSRGKTKRDAQIEARGHARIRANERCGKLRPVWVKNWSYNCAKSGKRYVCRAMAIIKCCH